MNPSFDPFPPMSDPTQVFYGTGFIQTYVVPVTGSYVIEASGAEGGSGGGGAGKGARIRGTFGLTRGDVLQIVVGLQGKRGGTYFKPAGGGGGGSFVWLGALPYPLPTQPMIAAGGGGGGPGGDAVISIDAEGGMGLGGLCGYGGSTDYVDFHYSGGGGAGWRSNGAMGSSPTYSGGGVRWMGGQGAHYCGHSGGTGGFGGGGGGSIIGHGSGGGGGYSGGGGGTENGPGGGGGSSYNSGTDQVNIPGIQTGDGCVSIQWVAVSSPTYVQDAPSTAAVWAEGSLSPLGGAAAKKPRSESAELLRCG